MIANLVHISTIGFMALALLYAAFIWKRQRVCFREGFALSLLLLEIAVALFFVATLGLGLSPWGPWPLSLVDQDRAIQPSLVVSDYISLSLIFLFIVMGARRLHRSWDGLKSVDQYRREQRAEPQSLVSEAFREIDRIAKRYPQWKPHYGHSAKYAGSQLQGVSDTISWKDRARELVRLSSSSYFFDLDSGWHDRESCWVGKNMDNDQLVILCPAQEVPDQPRIERLAKYAARISAKGQDVEIIVAVNRPEVEIGWEVQYYGVRLETEGSLLSGLVDFTDYRNEIRRRVDHLKLTESDLCISDTYVAPEVYGPEGFGRVSLQQYICSWLEEPGQRQLALLGEYGQGKSTTALMFTYMALCSKEIRVGRIPILIELRGTSPRNLSPLSLLGAWASKYNINPQALMHLHIAGRIFLIFEGFDEMALVGDSEMRLRHFKTLWEFCYPGAKMLITGRPNFFLDEEEMKAALGISRQVGVNPYCEAVRLAPFAVSQIDQALRRNKPDVREAICLLAERNPRFLELVSRPSLLHIVSVLWDKENLSDKAESLSSAYLMDLFVRFSYARQGLKEQESRDFMALTTRERGYFMSGVAAFMAAKDLPNQISSRQLNDLVDNLIESIPDTISLASQAISGESQIPLRQRLKESEHGLEHVKTDVRACGLLVDDPAVPGTFRFGHKSFMEYLFADLLAQRIRRDTEAASSILRTTGATLEDVLGMPVAVEFLGELISEGLDSTGGSRDEVGDVVKARRLWLAVFGDGWFDIVLQKIRVFGFLFFQSAVRRHKALAVIGFLAFMLAVSTILTWPMRIIFGSSDHPAKLASMSRDERFILMGSTLAALTLMMFMITFLRQTHSASGKLILWERLCAALSIDRSALERVSGQWLIPWARGLDVASLALSRRRGGEKVTEGAHD